jgi:hypothetical protein
MKNPNVNIGRNKSFRQWKKNSPKTNRKFKILTKILLAN